MKALRLASMAIAGAGLGACSSATGPSTFDTGGTAGSGIDLSTTTGIGTGGQGSSITNEAGAAAGNDTSGLDGGCGQSQISASNIPVNVLLVIDKSASMKDQPAGFPANKWSAMQPALSAALDQVKASISFGLEFFPNPLELTNPMQTCFVPAGEAAIGIPIGPGTSTVPAILEAIQEDMRKGGVSYPEMFKKIKIKLVNQYKAVL